MKGRVQRNVLPRGVKRAKVCHRRRRWGDIEQCVSIYLTRYDLDADEEDDLRQECLLKILRGLSSFKGRASISTWIYRIVRNEVLSARRRLKAHQERLTRVSQRSDPMMSFRTFEDRALSRVLAEGILARVKPLDREILRLRYLHGFSSAEVGKRLGLAPSTVRVRTMGCRTELRSLGSQDEHQDELVCRAGHVVDTNRSRRAEIGLTTEGTRTPSQNSSSS